MVVCRIDDVGQADLPGKEPGSEKEDECGIAEGGQVDVAEAFGGLRVSTRKNKSDSVLAGWLIMDLLPMSCLSLIEAGS